MDNSMKNKEEGCPKIAPNFVNRLIEDMHLIKGPFFDVQWLLRSRRFFTHLIKYWFPHSQSPFKSKVFSEAKLLPHPKPPQFRHSVLWYELTNILRKCFLWLFNHRCLKKGPTPLHPPPSIDPQDYKNLPKTNFFFF